MIVKENLQKGDKALVGVMLLFIVILFFLPTGFEKSLPSGSIRTRGRVIKVDNSEVHQMGIVRTGDQSLSIKLLGSSFKGEIVSCVNTLMGKLELDKIFTPGDEALVVINLNSEGKISSANAVDRYRINLELILFFLFVCLLVFFGGWTGTKAVISFVLSALAIWKVLLPSFLKGIDPVWAALGVVLFLSASIIFLIGGMTRKGFVAFLGAALGVLLTALLSVLFAALFKIHGAVKPFSETLLYSGYGYLDLSRIFIAGIFISSSGAVMDIAMDIAASQEEVVKKHPAISAKETVFSGIRVGRAVIGTMTTTLLLAYSGGFTTMLMVFMAQGTPLVNILNITYVSSEILHTLVGSFGLVTVAPFTALMGGIIYTRRKAGVTEEVPLSPGEILPESPQSVLE